MWVKMGSARGEAPSELRSNEPACRAAQRPSYNSYKILALLQKLLKLRIKMVRIVVQTVSLGAIREQEREQEQERGRARWSQ